MKTDPARATASNDQSATGVDIRDRLREDHEWALAELEALNRNALATGAVGRLGRLRRAWMSHTLAEETVVYRALESVQSGKGHSPADARFVEHERVEALLDSLTGIAPGTLEWHVRLAAARDLISRHIEAEHASMFTRLAERHDVVELVEMGDRFQSARAKLSMLEEAKAA